MQLDLYEKPQKPIFLHGFPSFGLIGTIVTEYLIDTLHARKIGRILLKDTLPVVAIHNKVILEPVSIYYCEQYNLVFMHILGNLRGVEWKFSQTILDIAKQLQAWEIVSIEGVADPNENQETQIFFHSTHESQKLIDSGLQELTNGIIMGVSGALLLTLPKEQRMTSLFATTHSQLPDSHAAAAVITALDSYLNLSIDPEPLLEQAKEFEKKIQGLLSSAAQANEQKEKKNLTYVG